MVKYGKDQRFIWGFSVPFISGINNNVASFEENYLTLKCSDGCGQDQAMGKVKFKVTVSYTCIQILHILHVVCIYNYR